MIGFNARIDAAVLAVIVWLVVCVPFGPVTVNDTVYVSAAANVCDGLVCVDVPPSPKFHEREVTVPIEASVNAIEPPGAISVADGVNFATGESSEAIAAHSVGIMYVLYAKSVGCN